MLANSAEPYQTPHSMVSDLSLQCLLIFYKMDARLKWLTDTEFLLKK